GEQAVEVELLVRAEAVELAPCAEPCDAPRAEIVIPGDDAGRLLSEAQALLAGAERVLRRLALADVADEDDETFRRRIGVRLEPSAERFVERLDGARDLARHRVPIAIPERRADDFRVEGPDLSAEELGRRLEQSVGLLVRVFEAPVAVDHEDAVAGVLERVRERQQRRLATRLGSRRDRFGGRGPA